MVHGDGFTDMETPKERLQNFKKEGLLSKMYNYSQSGFARFTFGIVALVELCHHIRGGNHQWLPLWIMWTAWVSAQTKNNDELHLHTSGLCEHLGFLARQGKHDEQCLHPSGLCKHLGFLNRTKRWTTSPPLWIVRTPGVSAQAKRTTMNVSTPLDCVNTWGF